MDAMLIQAIIDIGTSENDEQAYVNCEFHTGEKRALLFGPEIAISLCSAFLSATGHLQKKQAIRGKPYVPVVVEITESSVGRAPSPIGEVLLLKFSTKSGAELLFHIPPTVASKLANDLAWQNSRNPSYPAPQKLN
jgi:hypothetical protein